MKAACIENGFGFENLRIREREIPEPGKGEVLVRVRAASLNYRDVMVVDGRYNPSYPLPLTVGSDAVGEVTALGEDADTGLSLGDRVCPLFAQGWMDGAPRRDTTRQSLGGPLQGVFAEYALARADSVVKVPAYLSDAEAACLPCAALTAWSALVTLNPLGKGESVLTLGSGGVALFAAQIARGVGARVLATTRDPSKRERLERLGLEAVIDARQEKWGETARQLTGGEGVDHVVEVGGTQTLGNSLRAARPGGVISLIGVLGGSEAPSLLPVVMRNLRLQGVFVGHRRSFEAMLTSFETQRLRPLIDSVYPLERVGDAFARLRSGSHFGKVCLSVGG